MRTQQEADELGILVRNAWYLAAWSRELGERPLQRRICGEDVVLFRDGEGHARALGAVCPHRGANLGLGRVVEGTLQCPFHGWRYDGEGRCVRIPSQPPSRRIPPTARTPAYPLAEHQGGVWIWPGRACTPFEPPPRFAAWAESETIMRLDPVPIEAPFVNVVENAYDESHIHFLHERTLGLESPLCPRLRVARDGDGRGVTSRWDPDTPWGREHFESYARRPGWIGRVMDRLFGPFDASLRTWQFRLGGVVSFNEVFQRGGHAFVVSAITPRDEGSCWFFGSMNHPILRLPIPERVVQRIGRALIDEDRLGTEQLLAKADCQAGPISVVADEATLAVRSLHLDAVRAERPGADRPAVRLPALKEAP